MGPRIADRPSAEEADVTVAFYDVTIGQVDALRAADTQGLAAALQRPLRAFRDEKDYFATVVGYLEERGILQTEPDKFADTLMDLVEFHGGGWGLIERSASLIAALAPGEFSDTALERAYVTAAKDAGDVTNARSSAGAGEKMLEVIEALRDSLERLPPQHLLLIRD
jgi:hypothetical protein